MVQSCGKMGDMSKIPVEHTISGVRDLIEERMLKHPTMGKYLRPVHSAKPVIKFDAPVEPKENKDTPETAPEVDEVVSETRKEKK